MAFLQTFLSAQTGEVRHFEETVYGRKAFVIDNGIIRVSALKGGGHIAELRFSKGDAKRTLNPMRVPHYPTIEPYLYDPARHDAIFGENPHRWLHSGYMGHLLCFPIYGPPSEAEAKAGLGNHGEAGIVEWKLTRFDKRADAVTLHYAADLMRAQFRVERAITVRAGQNAVIVDEWIENLRPDDRPVNWMQHATFGPPFVEPGRNFFDVSGVEGRVSGGRAPTASLKGDSDIQWPNGTTSDGGKADLRPMQPRANSGTYYVVRANPKRSDAWFTLYHSGYPFLIGYVFDSASHPWIADWQENKSNNTKPWNGQTIARGIEFGSTPFAEGLRKSVDRFSMLNTPTFRWIGGRERVKTRFTMFVADIPPDFAGVADLTVAPAKIQLKERGSDRTIDVPAISQ